MSINDPKPSVGIGSSTSGSSFTTPYCSWCHQYHFGACNYYNYWWNQTFNPLQPKLVKSTEFYEDGKLVKKELHYE